MKVIALQQRVRCPRRGNRRLAALGVRAGGLRPDPETIWPCCAEQSTVVYKGSARTRDTVIGRPGRHARARHAKELRSKRSRSWCPTPGLHIPHHRVRRAPPRLRLLRGTDRRQPGRRPTGQRRDHLRPPGAAQHPRSIPQPRSTGRSLAPTRTVSSSTCSTSTPASSSTSVAT